MNSERLISADDFLDLFYVASAGQDKAFIKTVEMVVEDTPTIDAVEVVRCRDCKHWHEKNSDLSIRTGVCKQLKCTSCCISYCSMGERKMDEEVQHES